MSAQDRFTEAEVITAIQQANGFKSAAAKLLGCARRTIDYYCQRYPSVQEAVDEARETLLDAAEQRLWKEVIGSAETDRTLLLFTLRTLGRKRGYADRPEPDRQSGSASITVRLPDEMRQMLEANGASTTTPPPSPMSSSPTSSPEESGND